MSITDKLMNGSYPAVFIERWAGNDGWPCYKIFLVMAPGDELIGDGVEYETPALAREAAEKFGAGMLSGGFQIVDMTKEHPYG